MSLMVTLIIMTALIPLILSMFLMLFNSYSLIKIFLLNLTSINMSIDIMIDWTSMLFLSIVMMISSLIILFSKYYIPSKEQKQFLLLLLMFVLSMGILIMSNNLFLILLGWDGLGLSSYILVIYYQNFSSAASGTITLLSNRVGDILILLSMGLITLSSNWSFNLNSEYSMLVLIMLMIAACSKSAQFPFSAWLPMAMAAPTPISALVHSSTLVTAGVFLMLRISSNIHPTSMLMLLIISSSTAIYASMSANWEQDLKKIIALSTLSQIAMMMFAISMNSMILAFSHLIIHALFKSAMFLCAGTMIHESSYQDMRMMGMNFLNYPLSLSILGINSMALMGIPFMSGFFSKDMIIESMISSNMNIMMTTMMMLSIGMTAAYSIRMSFISNKSNIKINSLSSNHQSIYSFIPIITLSLFAITSGSWLSWLLSPEQLFMINNQSKYMILMILITGLLMGFSLQFKNKKYIKMGLSSISLWFTHFLSIIPTNITAPMMQTFHNNDKNWQENYGPNNYHNLLSLNSSLPDLSKSSLLMILVMTSIIPMFIL
uniref:NADH-ubiquinone oxidoreductase chain 5 n=1 Tax=Plexippus paykulli TaxID=243411 RepID=A0A0U1XDA1_PLEPA|nr:NADH dehydrogenase subunit 5 [Plexippus paykulli]AIM52646.1 NADH dehydrogenase subunit 5 [Plexippus paykulli]